MQSGFRCKHLNAGVSGAAAIDVDDGNTFTAPTVNLTARSGKSNVTEADAYLMSVNAGAINIDPAPNTAKATSEMTTSITVGDEKYSENGTLNVTATSEVDRKAYADTYTIGLGAASGRDRGQTSSKDKVSATVGSKAETTADNNKLAAVNVTATNAPDSNLKGLGAAGGILNIASQSFAENNSENTASTTIKGNWNIGGKLTMQATVDESVRESARQGSGEIAGGSGVYVDNTIKGTTTSTIDKSATINAANVDISAKNNIDTSGYDGDKYSLEDYFGGGIVIDGLTSTLTYDRDAGVKVNGTVTTSGDQNYTARTDGTLRNKVTATGGSIGGGTIAYSINTVDYDNTIEMDGMLNVGGALNAEANDGITLDTAALTEVGGGVEVLVGKAQNTINRTNRIETGGTLTASDAITLNAGGTKDDLLTDNIQTKIETQVDTKNYSVIPISANDATAKINSNSQIEISKNGKMESGVDVNLTANGGALTTYTTQEKWAWIDGGKTKSNQRLDSTGDNLLGTDNNYVKVDGTLKAGTANPDVEITIAGQAIPAGYTTTQSITPFTITKSREDIEVTTGTVDYANELSNRLEAINALIGDYTMGNLSNEALSGYVMERERILNKLDELGLLEYATESDGTVVPVPIMGSMFVVSTEIGNIEGKGGNVIINAGSLKGTGTIEAKGAPDVTIENTSNTWLRLNDIDLTGEGGTVKFNGYSVSGGDESVPASLTVKNAAINGDGNITVSNDPDRTRIALTGTGNYIPVGDVEILGAIDTPNGNVKISNTNGDIDIYSTGGVNGRNVTITTSGTLSQGYTAGIVNIAGDPSYLLTTASDQMQNTAARALDKRTASKATTTNADATMNTGNNGRIAGKNIYLAADYINVNGLIQAGYDSYIAEVNEADVNSNSVKAAASAALSGRSARTTNGYTGYFVKNDGDVGKYYVYRRSDAEDESTLEDGPLSDLAEMTQAMTDAYVKRLNSSSNYNVGANVGAVYNADKGYYDWYVPITLTSSNRLRMADIDTGGGTVYLSGRLLSTGNGRIWAANGLADIDIRNNTSLPLDVGQVLNADRSGRIVLADTGRDVWTEYTAGQTRTLTNYTAALQKNPLNYLNGAVTTKNTLGNGTTTSYTPADFTYNWTRGTTTKSRYSYEATQSEWTTGIILDALSGVGLVMRLTGMKGNPQPTEEQARVLASYENTQQATPQQLNDMGLTAGTYISDGTASDGLNLTTENIITDQPTRGGYTVKTDRDNYLVVEKVTVTANWYKDVGSLQAYTFAVPANKPITIGLMKGGSGNASFTSGGDLNFTSDVDLTGGAGEFRATSTGGSIRQDENAYVTACQAVLSAYKDINGFKLRALDYDFSASADDYGVGVAKAYRGMKLSAESTNGGKLNLTVDANTLSNGHVTPGDVLLDRFSTTGKASLTTEGSILSKSGELGGRTLNLTSNNGGIYLNGFTTDGITASATGDINLTNERINVGRLKTSGTVRLKVNELYSNGEAVEMLDEREKHIHAWIDAGLIAPIEGYEGAYADRVKKAVEKYESDVSEEYAQYEAIDHDEYNKRVTTIESEYAAYKDIDRTKYAATLAETAAEYDEYTLIAVDVQVIMQDYERYLSLVGTIGETYPDFPYLKSEFEGYDNVFDYIRDNAEDLGIDADLAAKYYGYSSAEEYLASNDTDGQLLAKYEGYDSAEAYITSNLSDSLLMSKYGSYANMAAYLAADATYQNLVTKRDGLYDEANYPTTLQELMDADEQEIKGELNIGAKALYVNNVKYRNIADVETAD